MLNEKKRTQASFEQILNVSIEYGNLEALRKRKFKANK